MKKKKTQFVKKAKGLVIIISLRTIYDSEVYKINKKKPYRSVFCDIIWIKNKVHS